MAALAQAAVSPATFETTLQPGESVSIDKVVDVPDTAEKVDIYFLADTTGSMGAVIAQVQADAAAVLGTLSGSIPDVQFGAGDYKDFPGVAFTHTAAIGPDDGLGGTLDASDAIAGWSASGGGDGPEGQFYALDQIASDPAIGWRADAQRIVVWFGDAPAHEPVCSAISGLTYDIDETSLTAKLVAEDIAAVAISTTTGAYASGLDDDPTLFGGNYLAACGVESGIAGQASRIGAATGGTHLSGVASADIAAAILAGISEVTVDVTADASGCTDLNVTFDPAVHEDVAGPTQVAFEETIEVPAGTPFGTYTCTVIFTASGGFLGEQTITINVLDEIAPTASCTETNNPGGSNTPQAGPNAGKSGQDPDGFYLISGSDAESGVASIVLEDTGSDASFALSDGDKIKLTQAPGAEPSIKPGAGDIDWQIKFKGDATLVVTDNAGNVTEVPCLVPQPAK